MNKLALFKALCLTDQPRCRLYSLARRKGLGRQQLRAWVKGWSIGNICRGCRAEIEPSEFAVWTGYWAQSWYPCHERCRSVGMKEEAFDCQKIDADCNDCKHYQRGVTPNPDVSPEFLRRSFLPAIGGGVRGNCLKFSLTVIARPQYASGYPCFEHRRSLEVGKA